MGWNLDQDGLVRSVGILYRLPSLGFRCSYSLEDAGRSEGSAQSSLESQPRVARKVKDESWQNPTCDC